MFNSHLAFKHGSENMLIASHHITTTRRPRVSIITCASTVNKKSNYVARSLEGSPVHHISQNKRLVHLLHPTDSIPFAMGLELLDPHQTSDQVSLNTHSKRKNAYELRYVLQGTGNLLVKGEEPADQITAGDTILCTADAVECVAKPSDSSSTGNQQTYGLASLVFYVPYEVVSPIKEENPSSGALDEIESTSTSKEEDQNTLLERAYGIKTGDPSSSTSHSSSFETLSPDFVENLLQGAKAVAREAFEISSSSTESLSSSDTGNVLNSSTHRVASLLGSSAMWLVGSLQRMLFQAAAGNNSEKPPPMLKHLTDLTAFELPDQTNRLALVFDPLARPPVPFVFGVEIFERGHRTKPHVHPTAHEVFFILSGRGEAFCDDEKFPIAAGDVVCFKPGSVHGIDTTSEGRMYCLEALLPDEHFAEFVRAGRPVGGLASDDMCILARIGCS